MSFRKDFVWGAATASYQIEGGYNADGKGLNIWDEFTHTEGKIANDSSGDIACDHYHRYKEDVKLMHELGIKAYRFSLSWSRIIPDGTGAVNPKGIAFYNNLIDELLKYGIEPFITLYPWDLPYALHLKGGWLNDDISDWFADYARIAAENFGDRVKNFITFNEPQVFVGCGYLEGKHAPGYALNKKELLHIGHNILLSHGKAVNILREKVSAANIGIVSGTRPFCPETESDIEPSRRSYFGCGKDSFVFTESYWFDPVVFGKYPDRLTEECADIMPAYSAEDMKIISAPIDFIGLNIYTGCPACDTGNGYASPISLPKGFPKTCIGWDIIPSSLYWGTKFHYERYKLPVYITENGMSAKDFISLDGKVHDPNRIDFLHRYLKELKRSADDGTDIRGYFQWSLMDNFEWASGYEERFGIVYVDYETGERTVKDSAYWYRDVIASNGENV